MTIGTIYNEGSLAEHLSKLDAEALQIEAARHIAIEKALRGSSPADMVRAVSEVDAIRGNSGSGKAFFYDPLEIDSGNRFREKPTSLTFSMLRLMAKTPMMAGIIGTRISQISSFSNFSEDPKKLGWSLRKKKKLFSEEKELTSADKKAIEVIANFLMNAGIEENKWHADTFDVFLAKIAKDTLELDQANAEIVRTKGGKLYEFYAVDAATFRYSSNFYRPEAVPKEYVVDNSVPIYAQVYNNMVTAEFYPWEMMFGVRNPSTDIHQNGYGLSEQELLYKVITNMLNADSYNGNFFINGGTPRGYFSLEGNMNNKTLNNFRSYWRSTVGGVENAHKIPVIEGKGISWVDMQKTNNDMQFHQWMEYLIMIASFVFKMDPAEAGVIVRSTVGGQAYSHKQKIDYSKDKGLVPILRSIERWINKWLVSEINPAYEFYFTGLIADDELDNIDSDAKKLGNWMTVDEIRAKNGLKPLGTDAGGDIILNSAYLTGLNMKMQGGQASNDYVDNYGQDGQQEDQVGTENHDETQQDINKAVKNWLEKGMPISHNIN